MSSPHATHIPILGNSDIKRQQEEERIRTFMQDPVKAAKIKELAVMLDQDFNASTKMIADIRTGATFIDTTTKKRYGYEYICQPFPHAIVTKVVMEEAKKPFKDIPMHEMYMVIYEVDSNPSPRYIIPALDFCKYFAIKAWVIVDPNNAEEKAFLDEVRQ